jgi:dTDP-4-dehydrorhamnose 3,5-epimerase
MFEKIATAIPGCFELIPRKMEDARGCFVKTYQRSLFDSLGLETEWHEEYYSASRRGVLRGMHFQLPPHDHAKLVYCTAGEVLDAVLDLRVGSPMYGQHLLLQLNADKASMIYIPKGCAHGFYTVSESATMMYKVGTEYAPEADTGVLWNSAGIPWPDIDPLISSRDTLLVPLDSFLSPFGYDIDMARP